MKNIVILGAGFAGLRAAFGLEKKFRKDKNIALTLIDKNDYQLFTPNLYRIAAKDEGLVSMEQIKNSISLPLAKILKNKKINLIKGEVVGLNFEHQRLQLLGRQVGYDFLVLAMGSRPEFFNMEGASKYGLQLKTIKDALRIRNALEFAVETHRMDVKKKNLRVVVAGGGYSGVELAGELKLFLDFLAWKNEYPREKIELEIIEANPKLVDGFSGQMSDDAYNRLSELGVRAVLSNRISQVDNHFIYTMAGEKISYDVLIWTTGVRAHQIFCDRKILLDNRDRVCVNEYLLAQEHQNIFVLGDMAAVADSRGKSVPQSAQDALDQADYLSYVLPYVMKNKKPPEVYRPKLHGFIVNIGGKWAIMKSSGIYLTGWLAYFIDQLAHVRYYAGLVGWFKAFKCVFRQMEVFERND